MTFAEILTRATFVTLLQFMSINVRLKNVGSFGGLQLDRRPLFYFICPLGNGVSKF